MGLDEAGVDVSAVVIMGWDATAARDAKVIIVGMDKTDATDTDVVVGVLVGVGAVSGVSVEHLSITKMYSSFVSLSCTRTESNSCSALVQEDLFPIMDLTENLVNAAILSDSFES